MLFSARCPVCRTAGAGPCPRCRAALCPVGPVLHPPQGLEGCVAAFAYEGVGRGLVTSLKYGNERAALPWMADLLAALVAAHLGSLPAGAAVTWVPTTAAHRRTRGFDQARLLARAVARRLGLPSHRLLLRGAGPSQTGRNRIARLDGPVLRVPSQVPPAVLVVDDVLTTGSSLAAAAAALHDAGAREVWGAVLASTPRTAQVGAAARRKT